MSKMTNHKFRWFYDYSGGQLTNLGVHLLDTLRWCLNLESPRKVTAIGGKLVVKDNREIPDTTEVLWDFGTTLIAFMQVNGNGSPGNLKGSEMEVRGTKGTMFIAPNGWEVIPEEITETPRGANSPLDRTSQRRRPDDRKL